MSVRLVPVFSAPALPGWRALVAVALALLCALQLLALATAPVMLWPERIEIGLAPGQQLTVGAQALAAPQADRAHLDVRRDAGGHWFVANASASRQLLLQRAGSGDGNGDGDGDGSGSGNGSGKKTGAGTDQRSGAVAPAAGDAFQIGAARFEVSASDGASVSFTGPGGPWRYDGARLLRAGLAQPACVDASLGARAVRWWNALAPATLAVARPLVFGGNLYCGNRLGIATVEPQGAVLALDHGRLLLSGPAVSLMAAGGAAIELARQPQSLAGVSQLVAGHTRFGVRIDGATLLLRPLSHVALVARQDAAAAIAALPPAVQWHWRVRTLWQLPAGAAWSIAAALCTLGAAWLAQAWQRGRWPFAPAAGAAARSSGLKARAGAAAGVSASALLAIAGLTALLLQRAGTPPGAGWSVLLGCAALASMLLLPGRLPLASACAALLLALGLLAQLDLGLAAPESSWLRHFQKTSALLAIGLGAGAHLLLRWRGRGGVIGQARLEALLAVLALVALLALAAQVLFGDETGVFDLQPVELAKLALCVLAAHCLAVGMGWHHALPQYQQYQQYQQHRPCFQHLLLRWCRLAAPALLFAALLALALLQVDDYSPLILLLVWSTAMAFAWALAARRVVAVALVVGVVLAAVAALAWLQLAGAASVAGWSFYADRFLVWLDPASHPHTGAQLLQGARAIADGAWWGSDGMLGLASLGQDAGAALRIPQVQDDFAPAFFLYRHGLAAALVLWLLQALFVTGVLQVAARAHLAARAARDFRQAWLGRFCCFALCGGAAFVLGHLLLSWGTNLAIFPIMGQPMSFLSAGGSHLLFFICPLLAFTAISAQTFEEMQSCPSTYNTKC